jgi:hypothetical protein
VFLSEGRELVLRKGERFGDVLAADELDEVLLQEVEVQRRVNVEDLRPGRASKVSSNPTRGARREVQSGRRHSPQR